MSIRRGPIHYVIASGAAATSFFLAPETASAIDKSTIAGCVGALSLGVGMLGAHLGQIAAYAFIDEQDALRLNNMRTVEEVMNYDGGGLKMLAGCASVGAILGYAVGIHAGYELGRKFTDSATTSAKHRQSTEAPMPRNSVLIDGKAVQYSLA